MIRDIVRPPCAPALASCQRLACTFARWLCSDDVRPSHVTARSLAEFLPTITEAEWVWGLLDASRGRGRSTEASNLLPAARRVAELGSAQKQGLRNWIDAIANVAAHFGDVVPEPLPFRPPNNWRAKDPDWEAFKKVLISFYAKGLKGGLPYDADGRIADDPSKRVTHASFRAEFLRVHRTDAHPDARDVCVLCGGESRESEVDHWMPKARFPLLSVCADNLLPICSECNSPGNKGQKHVETDGSFAEWFHPYLRHAAGAIAPSFDEDTSKVRVSATDGTRANAAEKLDELLNLAKRWDRSFRAEMRRIQRHVDADERRRRHQPPMSVEDLARYLKSGLDELSADEPNFQLRRELYAVLLRPARLAALLND